MDKRPGTFLGGAEIIGRCSKRNYQIMTEVDSLLDQARHLSTTMKDDSPADDDWGNDDKAEIPAGQPQASGSKDNENEIPPPTIAAASVPPVGEPLQRPFDQAVLDHIKGLQHQISYMANGLEQLKLHTGPQVSQGSNDVWHGQSWSSSDRNKFNEQWDQQGWNDWYDNKRSKEWTDHWTSWHTQDKWGASSWSSDPAWSQPAIKDTTPPCDPDADADL
jgi:hypothetical protein